MGLGNNEKNLIYLNISEGKIVRTVPEGTDKAVSRTIELEGGVKKTIHELIYDHITGDLYAIEKAPTPFKTVVWKLTIKDVDETFILSLSYSSRVANGFLKTIQN